MGQFVSNHSQLAETLTRLRNKKKVVFTNGCFDILHIGHVRYLQEAKAQGDILVIAINTDTSVQKIKGPTRPVQNQNDRAEILSALNAVDFVTLFDEETPENVIQKLRPDVLVKGGDWPVDKIIGAKFVMSYGGTVKSLQLVKDHSTTLIIEKMKS